MPGDERTDRAPEHREADPNPCHRGRKVFDSVEDLDREPGCDAGGDGYLQVDQEPPFERRSSRMASVSSSLIRDRRS